MERLNRIVNHLHLANNEGKVPFQPSSASSPVYQKTLLSTSNKIYAEDFSVSSNELSQLAKGSYVKMRRLKGGLQDNIDLIEICNGVIKAQVVPTRGMTIQRVETVSGDISLGWDSPVKDIVHPYYINLEDNNGLGWLYSFNGWMVRCGVEWSGHPGMDNGRLMSLHGKVAHIPASEVEVLVKADGTLILRGKVNEVWFKGANFEVWTQLELGHAASSFKIKDTVTNLSPKEQEYTMLYH
eukprot:jgi/Bigna1/90372/estExt_fgenesh1_pg.C_680073